MTEEDKEVYLIDLFKEVRVADLLSYIPFEKRLSVVRDLIFGLLDESTGDMTKYNNLVSLISDLHSTVAAFPIAENGETNGGKGNDG